MASTQESARAGCRLATRPPDTKAQTRQLRSGVMDRQYRPAPRGRPACEDESLHTAGGAVFSMRRAWVLKVARGDKPPQVNPALWVAYRMFVDEHLLVGKATTTGFRTSLSRARSPSRRTRWALAARAQSPSVPHNSLDS